MHNGGMSRRVGIVVAWFAATIVAIGVAATAVGSVRGQVTDVPVIPAADTVALLVTTTTAATVDTTTTTTLPSTTTTTATEGTTPPTTSQTTTTSTTAPQSTTTTTAPVALTTTTTVTSPAVTTYQLIGGQVTISALQPNVTLVGAVPTAGFSAEVDESGPEEVEVDFESSGHKSSFRARWEDGSLDIDIDEESEHDD